VDLSGFLGSGVLCIQDMCGNYEDVEIYKKDKMDVLYSGKFVDF
jgi:hypothetical protein